MNRIQHAVMVMKNGFLTCAFACMLSACAASGGANTNGGKITSDHVQHLVFVTLANPGDAAAMKADSDAVLPHIPGVLNYACGPHIIRLASWWNFPMWMRTAPIRSTPSMLR
jgi:hypothetical protein